jgi:hypothetical protein
MASGILSRNILTQSTDTLVYTVPAGTVASVTVSLCNQSTSGDARINMALTPLGASTANSYIEFNAIVPSAGVLERSAIVLGAAQTIRVTSTNANTSVVVFGIEETA